MEEELKGLKSVDDEKSKIEKIMKAKEKELESKVFFFFWGDFFFFFIKLNKNIKNNGGMTT